MKRPAIAFHLCSDPTSFPIAEQGAGANGLIGPLSVRLWFLERWSLQDERS
jgi:hypothetical protein